MTSIEMRSLILEALSVEDETNTPRRHTFKMYGYKGCVSDLRAITEHLAIKHGLIEKVVEIPASAWGCPGEVPYYKKNTSFTEDDLNLFSEEVHFLVFQNVISPGALGSYGDSLPYFHVTKFGHECLQAQDILPYDPERYLAKIKAITSTDDWECFYIEQSLRCYNAGALESSIIMLGLTGEYLAERLICAMRSFLSKKESALLLRLDTALSGKDKISQRYAEYEKILKDVVKLKDQQGNVKYPALKALQPTLDIAARPIYATFLRLTRNELAHPTDTKKDKIECLTMLVCFIKYYETQHNYFDFYIANS